MLRPLAGDPGAARWIPAVVGWVHEAGNPYFDWLFGGAGAARGILEDWMARESSEVSVARVQLLEEQGEAVGGILALGAEELVRCRKADTLAILKSVPAASRRDVMARMKSAAGLFQETEPGDFYLSKMGVAPAQRGRGVGARLVEAFLDAGRKAACGRYVLDVARDNAAAIALYTRAGFRVAAERSSNGGELRYQGMIRGAMP